MINKKIMDIMKSLEIDCYYQKTTHRKDRYVIFNVFEEKDTDVVDNKSISTTYYVTMNFWYKNPSDAILYKQIKNAMKSNKFKFDGCRDIVDINNSGDDYFGKNLDFIFKEFNLETL